MCNLSRGTFSVIRLWYDIYNFLFFRCQLEKHRRGNMTFWIKRKRKSVTTDKFLMKNLDVRENVLLNLYTDTSANCSYGWLFERH